MAEELSEAGDGHTGEPTTTANCLDFAWKVHEYTNEYIRFADPKAGICLVLVTGLVATLFASKAHHFCSPMSLCLSQTDLEATFVGITSSLAFAFLLVSAGLFVFSVNPRLWGKSRRDSAAALPKPGPTPPIPTGHIFWNDVLTHAGEKDYAAAVERLSRGQMLEAVTAHIYVLADVAERKFRLVRQGIWIGAIGAVFTLLALFVIRS